jgi:hypothetical protein
MKTKKKTTKRNSKKAGDFVKAGAYGCVFRPALKCLDSELNDKFSNGYVSKFMDNESFKDEMKEVQIIYKIFEPTDEYWQKKYFVLPLIKDKCTIDVHEKSNEKDITDSNNINVIEEFSKNPCRIKWDDIVKSPTSYTSLNMVDGGIDLVDYLKTKGTYNKLTNMEFNVINSLLIDLLQHGIHEMNNLGIYHFDINGRNIVYNEVEGQMRLVDWGFARYINKYKINTKKELHNSISHLKFPGNLYYGSHYGNALFNEYDRIQPDMKMRLLTESAVDVFKNYLTNYKLSHFPLTSSYRPHILKSSVANNYKAIINQPKIEYFNKIFLPNSDIFGFLLIYQTIFMHLESSEIKQNITNLIHTYVLEDTYSRNPYNIDNLVYSLRHLGNIKSKLYSEGSPDITHQRSLSPNTALLYKKRKDQKISSPEYRHLIKMNEARKTLMFSYRPERLSIWQSLKAIASGNKHATRKRKTKKPKKGRGSRQRRRRSSRKRLKKC